MPPKKEKTKWTIKRIAMLIGIITGSITIIVFGGKQVDKYTVTDAELRESENRIIKKIEDEAVTIRQVYIDDLIARKAKLTNLLHQATTIGEVELYKLEIASINERIKRLRGTN